MLLGNMLPSVQIRGMNDLKEAGLEPVRLEVHDQT